MYKRSCFSCVFWGGFWCLVKKFYNNTLIFCLPSVKFSNIDSMSGATKESESKYYEKKIFLKIFKSHSPPRMNCAVAIEFLLTLFITNAILSRFLNLGPSLGATNSLMARTLLGTSTD